MKFLGVLSLISFILCLFFADIKVNGRQVHTIGWRAVGSLAFTIVIDLFIGLPILGIISLFS